MIAFFARFRSSAIVSDEVRLRLGIYPAPTLQMAGRDFRMATTVVCNTRLQGAGAASIGVLDENRRGHCSETRSRRQGLFLLLRVTGKFAEWLRKVFTTVMNLIPKETKPLFLLPSLRPNDFKVEIARQGDGRPENHHLGL